jgi:ATPase subunit of ABC transporter with duplicated ATPase domains
VFLSVSLRLRLLAFVFAFLLTLELVTSCVEFILFTLATNHLDLETTEALIEAIRTFQGGVLLVSHDQHLLTSVCKDLYVVEKGKVERLEGGLSNDHAFKAYKKGVIAGRR